MYGVCTKWVICFLNCPHPRHSFDVLLTSLYRQSVRHELDRKYIDATSNLPFAAWFISPSRYVRCLHQMGNLILNSLRPRHSFWVLLAFVQTLYRWSIRRQLDRNYIDRTIQRCYLTLELRFAAWFRSLVLYGICTKLVI